MQPLHVYSRTRTSDTIPYGNRRTNKALPRDYRRAVSRRAAVSRSAVTRLLLYHTVDCRTMHNLHSELQLPTRVERAARPRIRVRAISNVGSHKYPSCKYDQSPATVLVR